MKTMKAAKVVDLSVLANKAIFVDIAMLAEFGIIEIIDTDEITAGLMCLTGAPQSAEELEEAQEFALFLMEQAGAARRNLSGKSLH